MQRWAETSVATKNIVIVQCNDQRKYQKNALDE